MGLAEEFEELDDDDLEKEYKMRMTRNYSITRDSAQPQK